MANTPIIIIIYCEFIYYYYIGGLMKTGTYSSNCDPLPEVAKHVRPVRTPKKAKIPN